MSSYSAADDWFESFPPQRPRARRGRKHARRRSRGGEGGGNGSARGGGEISPAHVLAPLLIGGALALVAIAGHSKIGAWLRGFFSARTKAFPPQSALMERVNEGLPLPLLRDSILGRRKVAVADLLGPPRTAVIIRPTMGKVGQAAFWRADTWYYAIDREAQTAMAVMFDAHGIASDVDFFDAPQSPADLPSVE
jgi:hypothetical protein